MTQLLLEETVRHADLESLVGDLERLHAHKVDVVVPATAIESSGGRLYVAGMGVEARAGVDPTAVGIVDPSDVMLGGIAEKLRIPVNYLRRTYAERPDLFDANVNGWLHGSELSDGAHFAGGGESYAADGRRFLVRTYADQFGRADAVGRALLSNGYRPMENLDVVTAVLMGVEQSGYALDLVEGNLSARRMYLRFASPDLAASAPNLVSGYASTVEHRWNPSGARRVGDIFAGIEAKGSEVGAGAIEFAPKITMLTCTNGMTINLLRGSKVEALRAVHIGARLDEGHIDWSAETHRRNAELVQSMAADAIRKWLSPEFIAAVVDDIEGKAGRELPNPADTIEQVSTRLSFTEETRQGVLNHFLRGGQATAGGVMNALTAYAQTVDDADLANELEALALQALEAAYRAS